MLAHISSAKFLQSINRRLYEQPKENPSRYEIYRGLSVANNFG